MHVVHHKLNCLCIWCFLYLTLLVSIPPLPASCLPPSLSLAQSVVQQHFKGGRSVALQITHCTPCPSSTGKLFQSYYAIHWLTDFLFFRKLLFFTSLLTFMFFFPPLQYEWFKFLTVVQSIRFKCPFLFEMHCCLETYSCSDETLKGEDMLLI